MTGILFLALSAAQVAPFNGKDLHGWSFGDGTASKSLWKVGLAEVDPDDPAKLKAGGGEGELVNVGKGVDLQTEFWHADVVLEIEVLVPKGAQSGIYLMGAYEVRIADSHGKEKVGPKDMGAIAGTVAPRMNAAKPSGEWQKLVIEFRAPKFSRDGRRTHTARFVKVELNGRMIHKDVELTGPSPGALRKKDVPKGPLVLKGDRGPVAFRKLRMFGATK